MTKWNFWRLLEGLGQFAILLGLMYLVLFGHVGCGYLPPLPEPIPHPSPTPEPTPDPCAGVCQYPEACPAGQHRESGTPQPPCYCDVWGPCVSDPTPPPPPPPSPPPAPTMVPLSIVGHRFNQPLLLGAVVCCAPDEYPANGWPLVAVNFLDDMKAAGIQATHIRVGPFRNYSESSPSVPGHLVDPATGLYDLTKVNPEAVRRVVGTIRAARERGIYVQVSLFDFWLQFNPEHSTMAMDANLQGYNGSDRCTSLTGEIDPYQDIWLRAMIEATRDFENVLYDVGNEAFRCRKTEDWQEKVVALVHALAPGKLVGANSEAKSDYRNYHAGIAPVAEDLPVVVNEYDADLSPEEVVARVRQAYAQETYFWYWRGNHLREDWLQTLALMKAFRDEVEGNPPGPGPAPKPIPETCPMLACWKPRVHNIMDAQHRPVPAPVVGGLVVLDSTPFFQTCQPKGRCNAEVNIVCGGRPCEDPRGVRWYQPGTSGVMVPHERGWWLVQANEATGEEGVDATGYQLKVKLPRAGSYTFCVDILLDLQDAFGKPVEFATNAGKCTTFEVP